MPDFANLPDFGGTWRSYGWEEPHYEQGVPAGVVPTGPAGKWYSGYNPALLRPGMQPGNWFQRIMPWSHSVPGMSGLGQDESISTEGVPGADLLSVDYGAASSGPFQGFGYGVDPYTQSPTDVVVSAPANDLPSPLSVAYTPPVNTQYATSQPEYIQPNIITDPSPISAAPVEAPWTASHQAGDGTWVNARGSAFDGSVHLGSKEQVAVSVPGEASSGPSASDVSRIAQAAGTFATIGGASYAAADPNSAFAQFMHAPGTTPPAKPPQAPTSSLSIPPTIGGIPTGAVVAGGALAIGLAYLAGNS